MSSLRSWAYLSRVVEGPSPDVQALLAAGRDADEIAHGVKTRATWIGSLARATERRYATDRSAEDLEAAASFGYSLLTPESAEWPAAALASSFGHGEAASLDGGWPPHALWVRGATNLATLLERSVAFVGTRAATPYGTQATGDLAAGLAKHSYTVVSGGALGIDTVAHQAALDHQTPTVVIAACGPGRVYPAANAGLFDKVATGGGAIVTEYPPHVTPDRHRFLTRNRLIAALTQGTIVVEAGYRSGALNTLTWATAFGRPVMAVPGSILSASSLGTNLAIYQGKAQMVLNAHQIHELLSPFGAVDAEAEMEALFPATQVQRLSRNELRVYDSLPAFGDGGSDAETIAERAGLTVALTVHILLDLQQRGVVERQRRTWHRVWKEGME